MTSLLERSTTHEPTGESSGSSATRTVRLVRAVAVLVPLVVWARPVTHGSGGRDPWLLGLGLLALLPALLVLQPWRAVPRRALLLALAPAAAAVLVCLTAPTRWDGADETASFVAAAAVYGVTRAWADTRRRRQWALAALAVVGLDQFYAGWLPWYGNGDVAKLMVGTFYWHNQFAVFMAATGVVAVTLALRGSRRLRLVGWLVAPLCVTGLLFSGSRASLAAFLAGAGLVYAASLRDRRGRAAGPGLALLSLLVASLLGSSLLMRHGSWFFGATLSAREADQSLVGNGHHRLQFWEAAWQLGLHHPVTGAGFDSFGTAGASYIPFGSALSSFAHNGYLQAWADGGLVLLAAVVAATLVPLVLAVRAALRTGSRRREPVTTLAVASGLLVLLLHSGVDFDGAYPSLVVAFAFLAALLPAAASRPAASGTATGLGALLVVLVVAAVPGALRASALAAPAADVPAWVPVASLGLPLDGTIDVLPEAGACRTQLRSASADDVGQALACTAAAAQDDPVLALERARAMAATGHRAVALRTANDVADRWVDERPIVRIGLAQVLLAAGERDQAVATLRTARADFVARGADVYVQTVDQLLTALGQPAT